jgi:alpha-1,6-mannosyltransferase
LVHKKAPELAIRAIRELTDRGRTVRLLVIGDGPLRAELESLAADLPVVFCGFVPEARRLFRGLDVLLLTSVEVEAFGMVALEAMASGVPVVAGPAPGPQFVLGGTEWWRWKRWRAACRWWRDRRRDLSSCSVVRAITIPSAPPQT